MKLGFLAGAILATWLSLTYPSQMKTVFDQLTNIAQQVFQSSPDKNSDSNMVTPDNDGA
ncbi:hypothetical protein [Kluyvera intermedia]|jgi:hypothetical protein|uniref:hypothetical protein n=1 Tax=Kluyvera intermedia TaxID=61648 RepID=UPI003525D5E5